MKSVAPSSLIDVPVVVSFSKKNAPPVRPGSRFEVPIVLANEGVDTLDWSPAKAPTLAYRWLQDGGDVVERDGLRTSLPVGPLLPGARVEIDLGGISPEVPGAYELQVSLVLEGLHWACDVGSAGWAKRRIDVNPGPAWPADLSKSRGARALRGAMVAAELAIRVDKRSLVVGQEATGAATEIEARSSPAISPSRAKVAHRFRNWLRAVLGVSGLELQLENIVTLAGRQEERSRELEEQMVLLREELRVDLESPAIAAPNFLEDLANARKKLTARFFSRDAPAKPKAARREGPEPSGKPKLNKSGSRTSTR